jgi:hypothetical protein
VNQVLTTLSVRELQIRPILRRKLVSEHCTYYAISEPRMGSNSIPDHEETRLCAGIASGSPPNTTEEIDPQELLFLREFFLLLDQWDRQQEK